MLASPKWRWMAPQPEARGRDEHRWRHKNLNRDNSAEVARARRIQMRWPPRAVQRTLRREALPLRSSTICVLKKPLTSPRADTATTILRCNYRRPLITGRASRAGPRRVIIPIQCRTRTVRAVCMHSVIRNENVWKVYPRCQALMCQILLTD